MAYQKLYFNTKALDVDTVSKRVKVAFAELESVDRDKDVIIPEAVTKTIKEKGAKGTNEIWHLVDHSQNMFSALGKPEEIGIEGKYLYGVSQYKNSFLWREVAWPLYESGDINQHSIGFESIKSAKSQDGSYNIIRELALWEGSAVLWGANPNTPTMQIVKSLFNQQEDCEMSAAEYIQKILKKLSDGKYEEKSELLKIELVRLQAMFQNKDVKSIFDDQSTKPEETATLPETKGNDLDMQIKLLILKHFD